MYLPVVCNGVYTRKETTGALSSNNNAILRLCHQRMDNVGTFSEARSEYTKQLAVYIVPVLVGWFQQLWARNALDKHRCMALFQTECEEIARWNQDRIHDEVRVLIERSGCDYMEELMTAVFIAHTKVLTAVHRSTKPKKLSITLPKLDHFIHRIFRETARAFWKAPFLFMESGTVMERQKNVLQIEALATEAITSAVRSLLPVKQILRDYMEDEEEVDDEVVAAAAGAVDEAAEEEEEEEKVEPKVKAPTPTVPTPAAVAEKPASPVPALATAAEATAPTLTVEEKPAEPAAPAVVKIDTENAVTFSDYDDVYEEGAGGPEMRYTPKDGEEDDDDEGPADGMLEIDESSARGLDESDAIDLEAPAAPVAVPAPPAPKKETIDDDCEVLE
jgi:hypothetical protein